MLKHLHIENIAVIEKSQIEFMPGFNVLTGETGAGKSIIIDSLCAILGARTSRDLIRHGQNKAAVSALFTELSPQVLARAQELGYPGEEESLLISREIMQDGKNLCRINGKPATVSLLKELADALVNIHGQNDGMQLLDDACHIDYLDSFGGYSDTLTEYYEEYRQLLALRRQVKDTMAHNEQLRQRADILQFQQEELQGAKLKPGEEGQLNQRRLLLMNVEKVAGGVLGATNAFNGSEDLPGITALLSEAQEKLRACQSWSEEIGGFFGRAQELLTLAQELERDLDGFAASIDFSPEELATTEERLDTITRLMKKYALDEQGLLDLLEKTQQELGALETMEQDLAQLNLQYAQRRDRVQELSQQLHQLRQQAAQRLTAAIEEELHQLDMPQARFLVRVESTAAEGHVKFTRKGTDSVVFLLTTNPGEEFKPMAKIASGGELSRIMLAIKSVLNGADLAGTLIFDEIDTGVSGRAANKVGEKLFSLSLQKQVLCVTHLPQIAALGQYQYLISKEFVENKTLTQVQLLDEEGRTGEIARMTAGMGITQQTLVNAREILSIAESFQKNAVDNRGKSC